MPRSSLFLTTPEVIESRFTRCAFKSVFKGVFSATETPWKSDLPSTVAPVFSTGSAIVNNFKPKLKSWVG